jgi:hypothetical protein
MSFSDARETRFKLYSFLEALSQWYWDFREYSPPDCREQIKIELEIIGWKYFGSDVPDVLDCAFAVKDESFTNIIHDVDDIFARLTTVVSQRYLVLAVVHQSICCFNPGHIYVTKTNLQASEWFAPDKSSDVKNIYSSDDFRKGERLVPIAPIGSYDRSVNINENDVPTYQLKGVTFLNIDTGEFKTFQMGTLLYVTYGFNDAFEERGPDMKVKSISFQDKRFAESSNIDGLIEFEPYFKNLIEGVEGIEGWWDFIEKNASKLAFHLTRGHFLRLIHHGYEESERFLKHFRSSYEKSPRYAYIDLSPGSRLN